MEVLGQQVAVKEHCSPTQTGSGRGDAVEEREMMVEGEEMEVEAISPER